MTAKKVDAKTQALIDAAVAKALEAQAAAPRPAVAPPSSDAVALAAARASNDPQAVAAVEKKLVRPPSARLNNLPAAALKPVQGPVRARMDLTGAPPDPGPAPKPGTDIKRFEGEIWCPAQDRPGGEDCQEHFPVKFDAEKGVYRGFCPKHTEIAVTEGGALETLKV